MTHDEFSALAREYGFERVFFLPADRYELGENPHGLVADVKKEFPFASGVAALVYPYAPFDAFERIPAYYLASNRAYHSMKALLRRLDEVGVRAQTAEIPIRLALSRAKIGAELRTGFRAIAPFGTRTVLLSIAVSEPGPLDGSLLESTPCAGCRRCIDACPAGAIGENGVSIDRCHRLQMESARHPDEIRAVQKTYIGCEICQYCCPVNARLARSAPDDDARTAFDTLRLIRGDTKAARALVGRNITSNGKLTAEAIAFAARDGDFEKEICEQEASEFDAVRDAVRYAKQLFAGRKSGAAPRPLYTKGDSNAGK